MSSLWFNLRIGLYHIQAGDRQWWRFSVSRNDFHKGKPFSVELYELSWPKSYIGGYPAE